MPPNDATLERLIAEQQERPLPEAVSREVRLPDVPGKADALVGMRRSGKTYRLFGEMRSLVDRGVPRTRILYLNLEDDRLGNSDLETLDRALEVFYRRDPGARTEGAWLFLDEVSREQARPRLAACPASPIPGAQVSQSPRQEVPPRRLTIYSAPRRSPVDCRMS